MSLVVERRGGEGRGGKRGRNRAPIHSLPDLFSIILIHFIFDAI